MPSTSGPHWRLIPCLQAPGITQMAIDTWLFHHFQQGDQTSILRFYLWDPPAISLGHLQNHWPAFWHSIHYHGQALDLVRRPTGGRAVLHQGDLCYSVVTSPGTSSRWQIYREICDLLILGWHRLGVDLHYGSAGRGYIHNPSCFNTATAADLITTAGHKLIGSAQRRSQGAILQQGSMILSTAKPLFEQIFDQPAPWEHSVYTPQQMQEQIPLIIDTLTQVFTTQLDITLIPAPLSVSEQKLIQTFIPEDPKTHSR